MAVEVFVQYETALENHQGKKPWLVKMCWGSKLLIRVFSALLPGTPREDIIRKMGFVCYRDLIHQLRTLECAALIMREEIPFSRLIAWIISSKVPGIEVRLYNQRPLVTRLASQNRGHSGLFVKSFQKFSKFNRRDISPVLASEPISDETHTSYLKKFETQYLPFVIRKPIPENKLEVGSSLKLLGVGKFRPYKNWETVIDALLILEPEERGSIEFRIVGQALSNEERRHLRSLREYELVSLESNYINYFSNTAPSEMNIHYRWADCLVLSSNFETASISVLEAMAWSVLPVTTKNNGTNSYFEEGLSGATFDPQSPEELAKLIRFLLTNRTTLSCMKIQAGAAARKRASEDLFLEQFHRIFVTGE